MLCCPSLPQRGPPSATFPHLGARPLLQQLPPAGPAPHVPRSLTPASFLAFTVCSRHTGLLCGNRQGNRPGSSSRATGGEGTVRTSAVLCGPPRIWTAGHGHGRPPSPPFPCTSEAGQVRPQAQACGAARHGRVTGSDPLGKDTGVLRAELARPLREPEPVALTLTLRLPRGWCRACRLL